MSLLESEARGAGTYPETCQTRETEKSTYTRDLNLPDPKLRVETVEDRHTGTHSRVDRYGVEGVDILLSRHIGIVKRHF